MLPRFIVKTHTGSLRPGNFSLLIARCTYPDKRSPQETVVKRLSELLGDRSSIARFSVLLSTEKNRGFGFLKDTMIWGWKGCAISAVLRSENRWGDTNTATFFDLNLMEKVCYLKYYLETEGALFLKIAQCHKENGVLSQSFLVDNIQEMFKQILLEYLAAAPDFRVRGAIRELYSQMRLDRPYDRGTIRHKFHPHLEAMEDLGLVVSSQQGHDVVYEPVVTGLGSTFTSIVEELVDIQKMESKFEESPSFQIVSKIYGLNPNVYHADNHRDLMEQYVREGYRLLKDNVTGMADIPALMDWVCAKFLVTDNVLALRDDVFEFFHSVRKKSPASLVFHLDGKGKIAYLIFVDRP